MRSILKSIFARDESGQALIELMLTIPLILVILGGALELARISYAAIVVTSAAKAAVAYGATNTTTAADSAGIQLAAQSDASNLPSSAGFNVTVYPLSCVCRTTTTTTAMAACSDSCSGYTIETLTVKTNASMSPLFNFPMFTGKTFNLTSTVSQEVLY
ncbi:MAG TPA: TadE/TadG family type IV pilus assembly protein [Terracidiphilus sp.]|nr:TadE/TadG family type IV pilus assembly protein [Terracidiphilus sp.]